MIASVLLTDTSHSVNQPFDYLIPEQYSGIIQPGHRVLVPFGVHNAAAEAIVVALLETSEYPRLKSLIRPLDDTPICTEELLQLCFRMQRRYFCSFQQAYKLVKPPRMNTRIRKWILRESENGDTKLSEPQALFLSALDACDGYAELEELEANLQRKSLLRTAYSLEKLGLISIREKIDDSVSFAYVRMAQLMVDAEEGYTISDELRGKRATVQADMLLALCDCGDMATADLVGMSGGNYTSLNALCEKGLVGVYKERRERTAYNASKYVPTEPFPPTEEQKPIIDHLNQLIHRNQHEKILLRGVTGSGKTEIFLHAIATCIASGKQAIMLVPEISLTPQMVERFVSRFGESVAVMHSGLSQGERFDQWHKIKNGEVHVVVGARSAVFAPFDNIGIIILDEEHEASYKSEITPRYHARDIAFYRGQKHGAPVLLASATPSVSSYYRAQNGIYQLFEMQHRFNDSPLPKARICDMRSELLDLHNNSAISIRLQDELRRNLENGDKSILFLNRRGYHTFVSCRECGYVAECPHCSIAMTYHKGTNKLVCHYCGYTQHNLTVCPECGSNYIKFFGTGTQKIEAELQELFPEAKILRMDFDTTSGKGGHEHILNQFRKGNADILLGTQMVTKGLDIPEVTLVGVLAADASLNINDYQANERCFSLITQVCGRAGRGDKEGRAVIQTYQPDNLTIRLAKEQNYIAFYENEIKFRSRMDYPPFCDIGYILVSGEDEAAVRTEIENIAAILENEPTSKEWLAQLLPPAPSPIAKIKNKYRYRILMKMIQTKKALPLLNYLQDEHLKSNTGNTLVIDINPVNMV